MEKTTLALLDDWRSAKVWLTIAVKTDGDTADGFKKSTVRVKVKTRSFLAIGSPGSRGFGGQSTRQIWNYYLIKSSCLQAL